MSEDTNVAPGGGDPITVVTPAGEGALSVTQAARALAQERHRPKEQAAAPAAPVEAAAVEPAEESTAQAEDGAPQDTEAPAEQTESADPASEEPSVEPPRSWTKDEKERFKSLPRETQEYLATREQERDRDIRRSQNEAADKLKGLTAKEQAVEQARQQYETALPQLLQNLQSQQQGEFTDVRTIADVERLAREDWPRYLQWDVAQKKIAAVTQEMLGAQQRQAQEKLQQFSEFARREDDAFIERVPDMADKDKAAKLQKQAMSVLKDLGFNETELGQSWNGDKDLSLRDHRVQLLIRDATLWREAQTKAKAATAKPVPPVQRPGMAQTKGASAQAEIQALTKQLETASGMKAMNIAARLTSARRAAR
jgi:hypothetical protein